MKVFIILVYLLTVTVSFAQQTSIKEKNDSVQNIDNMPILKGHGNALDMPTRNGKGEALPMPNRSMPVPLTPGEQISMDVESAKGQLKHWLADSLNRVKPNVTLPKNKN